MKVILALETSSQYLSASVYKNRKIYFDRTKEKHVHSEKLVSLIGGILNNAGLKLQELDILSCCLGPGSFTGIRSGISFMQGLSTSLDKKLVGFSSLKIVSNLKNNSSGWAIVSAGKENFYAQKFQNGQETGDIKILSFDSYRELEEKGAIINFDYKKQHLIIPSADLLCELVNEEVQDSEKKYFLKPIYVKKPEAKTIIKK